MALFYRKGSFSASRKRYNKASKRAINKSLYPESKSYYIKEIDNFAQVFADNSACKTDYQKLDKEMNWRNVMVIIAICI